MPTSTPNFQYPEDVPHVSGDRGTAALVLRQDVEGSTVDTNGDYALLHVDALGRLRVVLPANPPPKFARIDVQLLGNTTVVAAVPGKKIRVLGYMVTSQIANTAINVQFRSGLLTVLGEIRDIDGAFPVVYAGSLEAPAFETAVGESLDINLSLLKAVTGHLTYVEV